MNMGLSGRMKRATNNLAGKPPLGLKPDKVAKDPARLAAVANHHQGPEGIHAGKSAWETKWGPDTGFLPMVNRLIGR